MIILDNDYTIKEAEPLEVFEDSKPIIYRLMSGVMYDFAYCKEDIMQECALIFFKFIVNHYDYRKGVIIGKYLKTCYKNQIKKFLWTERRNIFSAIDEPIIRKTKAMDIHNWNIENMEFSQLLTKEQKRILKLILAGYEYSEICSIVCPKNKTTDPKRPIYRRMVKIKQVIAAYLELSYSPPNY